MKILIVDDEMDVEMLFRQKFRQEVKSSKIELVFCIFRPGSLGIAGKRKSAKCDVRIF